MHCFECQKDFPTFLAYVRHECPIAQAAKEKQEKEEGPILNDADFCECGHKRFWHAAGSVFGTNYTEKNPGGKCSNDICACEGFSKAGGNGA